MLQALQALKWQRAAGVWSWCLGPSGNPRICALKQSPQEMMLQMDEEEGDRSFHGLRDQSSEGAGGFAGLKMATGRRSVEPASGTLWQPRGSVLPNSPFRR